MLVAIDTETGGFVPGHHALLSIGACDATDPAGPCFYRKIDPGSGIVTTAAAQVNGFTSREEWGGDPLDDVIPAFLDWLPYGAEFVAHNAPFDSAFLQHACEGEGRGWLANTGNVFARRAWECSQFTARALRRAGLIDVPGCSLDALGTAAGYWSPGHTRGPHNALDDARACAAVYRWLLNRAAAGRPKHPITQPHNIQ